MNKTLLRLAMPTIAILALFASFAFAATLLQTWQSPTTGLTVGSIDSSGNATFTGTVTSQSPFVYGSGTLAATGTAQSAAAAITKQVTLVSTAGATAISVKLPNPATWPTGAPVVVCNTSLASVQTLNIFGYGSELVSGTAGATGTTIASGKQATLYTDGTNWIGQ